MRQCLRPFSHTPGAKCLLPGTHLEVQGFPTKVVVADLSIPTPILPKPFTLLQDLEKGCVWVNEVKVRAKEGGIEIGGAFFEKSFPFFLPKKKERLFLGMHKAQEFEKMHKRFDLREIMPLVFAASQMIPKAGAIELKELGIAELLRVGLTPFLTPKLVDDECLGIPFVAKGAPYGLLALMRRRIRELFFHSEGRSLFFLPKCPFASGKIVGLQVEGVGELDFSWRKGQVIEIAFRATSDDPVAFHLPGGYVYEVKEKTAVFSVRFGGEKLLYAYGNRHRKSVSCCRSFAFSAVSAS